LSITRIDGAYYARWVSEKKAGITC